LQSLFPQ